MAVARSVTELEEIRPSERTEDAQRQQKGVSQADEGSGPAGAAKDNSPEEKPSRAGRDGALEGGDPLWREEWRAGTASAAAAGDGAPAKITAATKKIESAFLKVWV